VGIWLIAVWSADRARYPHVHVTVPDSVCPDAEPDPGRLVNDALPDPSLLRVMVESGPEKSSPSTVTPAGSTSVYVPVPWNILFGAPTRKLISLPLTVVGIPSCGPIPRFHTNELLAKSEHENDAQSVVLNEPWTVSMPVKFTWKVRLAVCPPPPPPLPGVGVPLPLPGVFPPPPL